MPEQAQLSIAQMENLLHPTPPFALGQIQWVFGTFGGIWFKRTWNGQMWISDAHPSTPPSCLIAYHTGSANHVTQAPDPAPPSVPSGGSAQSFFMPIPPSPTIIHASSIHHDPISFEFETPSTMITSKKKKKKEWFELLDKYPSSSPKDAITERICVVSGRIGKAADQSEYWLWRAPYWVYVEFNYEFDCQMKFVERLREWRRLDDLGSYQSIWDTKDWFAANGYVKISPMISSTGWVKKSEAVEFYSPRYGLEVVQYAQKTHAKSIMLCAFTNKPGYYNDLIKVITESGTMVSAFASIVKQNKTTYPSCHNCSVATHKSHAKPVEGYPEGESFCPECYGKIMASKVIRAHDDSNFLPPIYDTEEHYLKGKRVTKSVRRLFGVEVELGFNTGDRVQNALDVWNVMGHDFAYIKHDGSITNSDLPGHTKLGFEIVTAPTGLNVQRERWKSLEKAKAFKTFRAWDTGTCGFHVHVSRDSLSPLQIGRILVFINHPNNRYFIEVVAGRSSNKYTKFINKRLSDCEVVDESKYMAVRTNKPNSIEFRIFRGTVNYRHIIRNIEFCDAVCDFCAPCTQSMQAVCDFRNFLAFVNERKGWWPILEEWLQTMDMVAKKPIPKSDKHFKAAPLDEVIDDRVRDQLAGLKNQLSMQSDFGQQPEPKPVKKKVMASISIEDEGGDTESF